MAIENEDVRNAVATERAKMKFLIFARIRRFWREKNRTMSMPKIRAKNIENSRS